MLIEETNLLWRTIYSLKSIPGKYISVETSLTSVSHFFSPQFSFQCLSITFSFLCEREAEQLQLRAKRSQRTPTKTSKLASKTRVIMLSQALNSYENEEKSSARMSSNINSNKPTRKELSKVLRNIPNLLTSSHENHIRACWMTTLN